MNKNQILIVDDKEDNRYLLRALLQVNGYEVATAAHGAEALALARQHPPDLIIADVLMPVMDGFSLCREWKKDARLNRIPFIFYTATYTDERDRAFALSLGAEGFIVKPEEPEALLAALRDALQPTGKPSAAQARPAADAAGKEERVFLKQYNEALVRKLEAKMLELEQANRRLEQDVARRRQMEITLRESEDRFRSFVENANDIVYALTPAGVFTYVSPNWTELLGHAVSDVVGKSFGTFVHPEDISVCLAAMERAKATGRKQAGIEYRVRHKNGAWRWQMTNGSFVRDAAGTHCAYLGIARDITDRKQAEIERERMQTQLTQAQKMESVGRLAGGVAHDFNNMLGAILGHAELALENMPVDHPLHADLMEILKATRRSADLTRQLLAFARKQTIAPRVLDLNQTVEGMLQMLRRLIGENIDLLWRPDPALWPVKMDPSQIDQILANLCVNARDAIAGVGTITIETENATLTEDTCAGHAGSVPGEFARLNIRDDGCGMNPETQLHLFEPFFTTKDVGKGTGLGLATVYGIVKQNQGFLTVYSEPGKGTLFQIFLPRHAGKEQLRPTPDAASPARGQETVLLVEDEPAILNTSKIMLERLGYQVLGASTPGEAIRLAEQHPGEIHLLMSDVVMPEMNGRDLAKNLLPLRPDIKRLFMSGYTADVIAHHGVLHEGVDFIQKPFSTKDLSAKVRQALDGP